MARAKQPESGPTCYVGPAGRGSGAGRRPRAARRAPGARGAAAAAPPRPGAKKRKTHRLHRSRLRRRLRGDALDVLRLLHEPQAVLHLARLARRLRQRHPLSRLSRQLRLPRRVRLGVQAGRKGQEARLAGGALQHGSRVDGGSRARLRQRVHHAAPARAAQARGRLRLAHGVVQRVRLRRVDQEGDDGRAAHLAVLRLQRSRRALHPPVALQPHPAQVVAQLCLVVHLPRRLVLQVRRLAGAC